MDAEEFQYWIASEMLDDKKTYDRLSLEISAELTDEERAIQIKKLFNNLGNQ